MESNEIDVAGGVVATQEAVEFLLALGRRDVGGVEGCPRRAREDGVADGVGHAGDRRGDLPHHVFFGAADGFVHAGANLGDVFGEAAAFFGGEGRVLADVGDLLVQFLCGTLAGRQSQFAATISRCTLFANLSIQFGGGLRGGVEAVGELCERPSKRRVLEQLLEPRVDARQRLCGLLPFGNRCRLAVKHCLRLVTLTDKPLGLLSKRPACGAGLELPDCPPAALFKLLLTCLRTLNVSLGTAAVFVCLVCSPALISGDAGAIERRHVGYSGIYGPAGSVGVAASLVRTAFDLLEHCVRELLCDAVDDGGESLDAGGGRPEGRRLIKQGCLLGLERLNRLFVCGRLKLICERLQLLRHGVGLCGDSAWAEVGVRNGTLGRSEGVRDFLCAFKDGDDEGVVGLSDWLFKRVQDCLELGYLSVGGTPRLAAACRDWREPVDLGLNSISLLLQGCA